MDLRVSLPWELEEDILSRLPPQSLVRFRAVSKRWNSLVNDKSFINKHLSLSRPQFIFLTKSKIYSIDIIDQRIKLRELQSSCSRELNSTYGTITTCDDLLFCKYPDHWKKETALWNPWLRQVNWIKLSEHKDFEVFGLGYDSSGPQKVHKILFYLGYYSQRQRVWMYECASQALKFIDTADEDRPITETDKRSPVSLYGNLYWITYNRQTHEYFIQSFDFTRDIFKPVCLVPFQDNHCLDQNLLAVWKGDRFSLLKQSFLTRKIEIWVMENKIDDKEEVVWLNLMTLTASNLPELFHKMYGVSYFIYDMTLFMCCGDDETSEPCIYIGKGDVCNKIQIGCGQVGWFSHCAYVPNLISVPLEFQI
ncbi:Protein SUPPRESSOR OF NIM1 1 [Raphanus sativus]|uniref:Protein SUPPRESSOR OF NIM1 1-like n=1 Tax=Raphanus sativus TaxID=3726 RepID=A0A6J0JS69_RAPSA|nr:protein SUPPRESSOR OF NIM1 1-like [Raphanus sativus]KAJ4886815.1 Protein SUPPRESSOR OF NIM1 1 [Raphanus sativus]